MRNALKILLRIIYITEYIQRNGLGTRDAHFGMNVLMQSCLDVIQDVYVCLIDFENSFDKICHEKLLEFLKRKNIDSCDIRIISNMYWNQKVTVKVENVHAKEISIIKGVLQTCVLSPLLFILYIDSIFEQALTGEPTGIIMNGQPGNNMRYADDTVY